ncbi:MAG: S8 family serine peptidase [Lachnospiraceae bacterium]
MRGKTSKKMVAWMMQISILTSLCIGETDLGLAQEISESKSEQVQDQTPDRWQEQTADEQKEIQGDPQEQEVDEDEYRKGKILVLFRENALQKNEKGLQAAAEHIAKAQSMELTDFYQFGEKKAILSQKNRSNSINPNTENTEKKESDLLVGVLESNYASTEQMLRQVEKENDILMAEPVYLCHTANLTSDSYAKEQWALENQGQNGGTPGVDLHLSDVWNGTTGTDQVIAVVDTGIDYQNPEFINNMWVNPYQGVLPGEHGYDFVNEDADPMDDNGHGTHCSGILAAEGNNEMGISGICQKAKIMALKFLDEDGLGDTALAIQAYQYIYDAIQLGVPVTAVNNSWTGGYSRILAEVVTKVGQANALSIFAAGNDAENVDNITQADLEPGETAVVESPYAVSVAAVNEKGELAQFSNYGKQRVTLAAAGCDSLSCVTTPVFNPGIYDDELRNRLCSLYRNYDGETVLSYQRAEDGSLQAVTEEAGYPLRIEVRKNLQVNRNEVQMEVAATQEEYFGSAGGQGLCVSVKGVKSGDVIYTSIPFELLSNQTADATMSFQTKAVAETTDQTEIPGSVFYYELDAEEAAGKLNDGMMTLGNFSSGQVLKSGSGQYWDHITQTIPANKSDSIQKKMLVIQIVCAYEGDYTLYLDDFGVTKGENNEQELYGKYEFANGTSMAAPCVTAAAALLSESYPKLTALERVNMLKSCVSKTEELEEKTECKGMLDFNGLKTPAPVLYEAVFSTKNQLRIAGYGFQKEATTVVMNGKEKKATVTNANELLVNAAEYKNKQVQICVKTAYGTSEKTCYLVKGKTAYQNSGLLQWENAFTDDQPEQMRVVSDGTYLYLYRDSSGSIFQLGMEKNKVKIKNELYFCEKDAYEEDEESFKEYHLVSNLVCLNGKLYALLSIKSNGSAYQQIQLISVTVKKNGMSYTKMGTLPSAYKNRSDMTLGVYNGKLYLIGGYDYGKRKLSTSVMVASNPEKKNTKWKKAPSLPTGRAAGECIQSGKKLYYALGAAKQADNNCPKLLSFDGKTWKEEGARMQPLTKTTQTYQQTVYDIYRGNLGICKQGLLFTGIPTDGLGDTFYYLTTKKTYQATEYNCIENLATDTFAGSVVGNQLIGISEKADAASLRSVKVKSGIYTVTTGKKGSGTVNVNKKKAVPGEKITISLSPKKGCRVQTFQVNGKKVKGKKKTLYATQNVKIKVIFVKKKTK